MKVKFYKIKKQRLGSEDVVVIYSKGSFSGTMEVKDGDLAYHGRKDEELLDILFRPYHMMMADSKRKGSHEKLLAPGTTQHLEAIRRSCWNHGYVAEVTED